MKIKPSRPTVEPLESRIAPARIINVGLPNNPNDTDYNEAPFVDLENAAGTDLIAAAVGKGIEGTADTFYIRLSAGDSMNLFRFGGGASSEPFLIVKSGSIAAFFTDKNLDNEVQEDEITGIAMGKGASFELRAALSGDVVANLDENGTKDQSDDGLYMGNSGLVPSDFGINGIKIGSSVGGYVDAGVLFQAAQETTTGGIGVNEVQKFSIDTGLAAVGESFRVTYGGNTTKSLAVGATGEDVQAALNSLKSIKDVGEVVVTKSSVGPVTYTVTFKLTGDQANLFQVSADSVINFTSTESIVGDLLTPEVQTLDLGLISGKHGRLTLNFDGEAAAPLAFGASAADVASVLNATNAITAFGGVDVTGADGGPFTITFHNAGNAVPVTARAEEFFAESVGGSILASGNISNVVVAGGIQKILAGSAADTAKFDFFPKYFVGDENNQRIVDTPGGDGVFSFQPASGKLGSSVSRVIVDGLGVGVDKVGRIEAGRGGDGAKGGSINNIEIRSDADGFNLIAGDGGDSSQLKPKGGAGGGVANIYIDGAPDVDGSSPISVLAGDGGSSTNSSGGAGGSIVNLNIGYRLLNNKPVFNDTLLRDNVLVRAGDGGSGKIGASGGSLSNMKITVAAPNGDEDELQIFAGDGGDGQPVSGGRGGVGGSVSNSTIQNVDLSPGHGMSVLAGDGGSAGTNAKGAAGGSLLNLILTGRQFELEAGDGTTGKTGGIGGSVKSLEFRSVNGVFVDTVALNAGRGGDGLAGNAGNGGAVSTLSLIDSDLFNFTINDEFSGKGDGGQSTGGKGGLGGSVTGVKVTDYDYAIALDNLNLYKVRGGDGGSGTKGGGNGGSLTGVTFTGVGIEIDASAGSGGNALTSGAGGKGGNISQDEFAAKGTVLKTVASVPVLVPVDSSVRAGLGGSGAGLRGIGGIGGGISVLSLNTEGGAVVSAGDGGNGSGAAPGRGGNIHYVGLFATFGDGTMTAGNGGLLGTKAAFGGSITGVSDDLLTGVFAAHNVTVRAGDGTNGGSGGSIKYFGYGSTASGLVPTPTGDINIFAGQGSNSTDNRYVGAGGSISNVNGSVSFVKDTTTLIQAGAGGSTPKKGGAGGNITNLSIQRGGNAGVEFSIVAGDAGDSVDASTGAKGGSVSGVKVIEISQQAIFRHIAAGDGGNALKKGGIGGSVANINVVNHDIGLRNGAVDGYAAFGYNSMGGIFAGDGGSASAATGTKGISGNVTNVTADAIGSIVAGRAAAPQLVNKVENIYLNGSNLLIERDGAFEPLGVPGVQEEQRFTPVNGLPFVISFAETPNFANETIHLAAGSTSTEVEEALNNIPSIFNAGGVTVTQPAGSQEYRVTFNNPGDQPPLHFKSQLTTNELVAGNFLFHEVQSVQIDPVKFKGVYITYGGNTAFFNDASQLTASDLQVILNQLGADVIVTEKANHTYQITFNLAGFEQLIDFDADKRPSGFATEFRDGTDPSKIVYIYNNGAERSVPVLKNADPGDVANAINALPTIQVDGTVSVTALQPNGYRFEFNTPGNTQQITAEELIVYRPAEELRGQGDAPLPVVELVPGDFEHKVNEVQTVKIDSKLLGRVTVNFGSSATDFSSVSQINASSLESKLNLLANVAAVGGVTVADLGGDYFQITFKQPGDQRTFSFQGNDLRLGYAAQITQGTASVPEVQIFTPIANKTLPDQTVVAYTFKVYFGSDSTNFLPSTSSASSIQTALNGLQSVIDAGGVTVVKASGVDTFVVTFNQNGNQEPLYVINKESDNQALLGAAVRVRTGFFDSQDPNNVNGLNTTEIQTILLAPDPSGFFDLAFEGNKTTSLRAPIDQSQQSKAQTALAIDQALNALDSVVAAGGVTVGITPPGQDSYYTIEFNSPGLKSLFTGNSIQVQQVLVETVQGSNHVDTHEVQGIVYNPNGTFKVTFPANFDFTATEFTQGSGSAGEVQQLDLSAVEAIANATFTLAFGADVTASLPSNADAVQIEIALNALTSIQNAGGVTVALSSPGVFSVTFGSLVDQLQVISGTANYTETTIDINAVDTPANISQALQSALNALPSIAADGGVTVQASSDLNTLNVIFNSFGDKPALVAGSDVHEIQSIPLLSLGEYEFTYNGDTTPRLPAGSATADVEAAINALPGIPPGGVTVTNGVHNDFTFTFNTPGDFGPITANQYLPVDFSTIQEGTSGSGGLREQQEVTQPRRYLLDQLNFGTANLVGGLLDATEFDAHVFKWQDTNNNDLYDIGEIPIDGLIVAKNYTQALTGFIPEARYTGGEFTFAETTAGDLTHAEVQTLTIKADKFSLAFDGDETAQLSGKSKASTIAKALNALPSIISAGGVNVTSGLANTFTITFNLVGSRSDIIAPFFYDFNNILH